MIEVVDIAVRLGGRLILDGVSLRIAAGELVAIVGVNGAGKSTLLRAVSGDLPLARGRIGVLGLAVDRANAARLARVRAFLPQASALEFPFSAFEVALLGRTPHLHGGERVSDLSIAEQALAVAEVSHLRDRSYLTLSGGEKQRVQLARVLAQIWDAPADMRCLLLDEPTAGLDLCHQHALFSRARELARDGATVVAVMHDLNLAAQYADRIVVLERGGIGADGPPRDVLTADCLARAFAMRATILDHPECNCPLVVAVKPIEPRGGVAMTNRSLP